MCLAALLVSAAAGPAPAQAKYFSSSFGGTGTTGGLFGTGNGGIGDIAVNDPSVEDGNGGDYDGWIYVVDRGHHRVQAFDADRNFRFAIGRDVVQGGGAGDAGIAPERCTVASECKAGASGNLGGEFNAAVGIDIDQETGHLFVRERGGARVQELGPDGAFVRAWGFDVALPAASSSSSAVFETCFVAAECKAGVPGSGLGQFGASSQTGMTGIAVAPSGSAVAGDVYVADPGGTTAAGSLENRRVLRFEVPEDPNDPVVPVAAMRSPAHFGPILGVGCDFPRHVAVDSNGVVYATGAPGCTANSIVRYDSDQDDFGEPIPTGTETTLGSGAINALAVDTGSDTLLVGRPAALGVIELDISDNPAAPGEAELVDRHGAGLGLLPSALAVNPAGHQLFIPTSSAIANTGSGHRVLVFDDTGVQPVPEVELLPAIGVGCDGATLRARVNPRGPTGFPTHYRFQVSPDGVRWEDITDERLVGATGESDQPEAVSDIARGLEANSLYRMRVVTTRNPAAGLAISPELIFSTNPCPPTAETVGAQRVTDGDAQLVGMVNPNGLRTTYWFEWGDTDYGNTVPVPAAAIEGGVARRVVVTLSGLRPDSAYHFRACARSALSLAPVCGADRVLHTRPAAATPEPGRAYEMVTSPDKVLRRGGQLGQGGADLARLQGGLPGPSGNAMTWSVFGGVTDPHIDHGFAWERAYEIRRRSESGWFGEPVFTIPPVFPAASAVAEPAGLSADLETQAWTTPVPMFSSGSTNSVHVMGDTGGPRGAGWYPMLDSAWYAGPMAPYLQTAPALIDDDGDLLLRVAFGGLQLRDVKPSDSDTEAGQLDPAQTSGRAVLSFAAAAGWRPTDLINECTGIGATATLIPSRGDNGTDPGPPGSFTFFASFDEGSTTVTIDFNFGAAPQVGHTISGPGIPAGTTVVAVAGSTVTISAPTTEAAAPMGFTHQLSGGQNTAALADDVIAARGCAEGSPTDVRGATIGSLAQDSAAMPNSHLAGTRQMALSDDGRRVFFVSPDPDSAAVTPECGSGSDQETRCPPQLFVRQYADDGRPTVRWLSRAEDALANAPQRIAAFGNGVAFEGASRDGSVVYFRTNAPLTSDDPNGGEDPTVSASPNSWDLYRYDLGSDLNADPGNGDSGGRLTRISGGPDGGADPNTNCTVVVAGRCTGDSSNPDKANGSGAVARFISDNGERVYFVTAARIQKADNSPPAGGATTAGAVGDQLNETSRNLYLYDGTKSGPAAYKFIARIPFDPTSALDGCASWGSTLGGAPRSVTADSTSPRPEAANCVHGSTSGDAIVWETTGRLTADDTDDVGDVYLYDATADTVTRLSSPPAGAAPYDCGGTLCNGDLGMTNSRTAGRPSVEGVGFAGLRHWNVAEDDHGRLSEVVFESRLQLTGGFESDHMNVFRWRRSDGRLQLVSPGDAPASAFYTGNSRDGSSVFFWTEQRISPWEIDDHDGDIYASRIGNGVPDPPAPPPVCHVMLDACQDGGFAVVSPDTETSSSTGSGDVLAERRRTLAIPALSRRALRKAARSGVIAVRVRSDSVGRVRLTAKAKLGRTTSRVGDKRVRVRRAGTMTVNLPLNGQARKRLRSGKNLRVTIEVRQAGARPRTRSVLLPGAKR